MRKIFSLIAMLGLCTVGQVAAQAVSGSASITIPQILAISGASVDPAFGTPVEGDYDAGYVASTTSATLSTKGNVRHNITIVERTGTATYMTASTGAWAQKPIGDFRWCISGCTTAADFKPLTTTDTRLLGTSLNAGEHSTVVNYRMLLNWVNDLPGTYSVDFTYTVVPG